MHKENGACTRAGILSRLSPSLHGSGDERWPTEVTSNAYFRCHDSTDKRCGGTDVTTCHTLSRLADFAKLYDVIKNERNKCVNLIQTSTQVRAPSCCLCFQSPMSFIGLRCRQVCNGPCSLILLITESCGDERKDQDPAE